MIARKYGALICILAALGHLACEDGVPRTLPQSEATPTKIRKVQQPPKSKPVHGPIDWTKSVAFRPPLRYPPFVRDFCTDFIRFDLTTERYFVDDNYVGVEVRSMPEAEPAPHGYSNVWHDNCPATLSFENAPRDLETSWAAYHRPREETFRRLFSAGQTIYWMSERGSACVPLKVERNERPAQSERDLDGMNTTLGEFAAIDVPEGAMWGRLEPQPDYDYYIPFAAVLPERGNHGYVFMGTWQNERHLPFFKCECERLLRFMRVDEERIEVLPRRFPADPRTRYGDVEAPTASVEARFYSTGEVELWFWDRETCEDARTAALERIKSDGRLTVSSGFYAGYNGYFEP